MYHDKKYFQNTGKYICIGPSEFVQNGPTFRFRHPVDFVIHNAYRALLPG